MSVSRRKLLGSVVAAGCALQSGRAFALSTQVVQDAVDAFANSHDFNGVIAVAVAGRQTMAQTYGFSDVRSRNPATSNSAYAIGSISKWFTAVLVLRLIEMGTLSLDTPLSTLLPEFPESGRRVTLNHLLSNTSGLPDLLMTAAKADSSLRTSTAAARDIVNRFAPLETKFEPGSQFDYAFMNWVIIRAVIEAQTGAKFEDLVQKLLFEPAGIKNTGIATRGFEGVPGLVPAFDGPTTQANLDMTTCYGYGAASGTFYSTASDLIAFADHVMSGALLSPESRSNLMTIRYQDQRYALGGRVRQGPLGPVAWETGAVGGYKTLLAYRPTDRRSVVVLSNTDLSQDDINVFAESIFELQAV